MKCENCGADLAKRQLKFCSRACRFQADARPAALRYAPCDTCGKPVDVHGRTLTATARVRCRACRRLGMELLGTIAPRPCQVCGVEFAPHQRATKGKFCSRSCSVRAQNAARYGADLTLTSAELAASRGDKSRRRRFETDAAGVSWAAVRYSGLATRLRMKPCAYCGAPAGTIDHVVPLIAGGLNTEGNLVPACLRCNSSKSGRLLAAWRYRSHRTVELTAPGMQTLKAGK